MNPKPNIFPATGMPDPDWWQALWPDPANVLIKTGFAPGDIAVDLCCGDGLFTVPMSALLQGQVYAVDLDAGMLQQAQAAVTRSKVPDCKWIAGDARGMVELVPEKVDKIFIANTFHGVPEQTKMAESAFEVLKSGGRFIVLNWHAMPREKTTVLGQARGPRTDLRMSPMDVRRVVEPAGLDLVKTVEFRPYHYAAIFQKD